MRAKAAAVLVFALAAAPVFSITLTEVDANFSLLFIGSAPPDGFGGPSPVLQSVGASLPLAIGGPFFLEPTIDFFGTYYEWTGTRAVPTSIEAGPGFFTLGALLTLQSGLSYPVSPVVTLGGSLGLDFILRFPFDFSADNADRLAGKGPALAYFFGKGRFFSPETRFFVRWQVSETTGLVFNARVVYPVHHLWDGEGLPFVDQLMVSAGLGFVIRLSRQPPPADASP